MDDNTPSEANDRQAGRITSVLRGLQLVLLIVLAGLFVVFAEPLFRYVWLELASDPQHL